MEKISLSVAMHKSVKSSPESVPDTIGEIIQLETTASTFFQLKFSAPTPARPAPTKAPTSECVVLIGIPKSEEARMKINDDTVVDNIILSWF